MHDFLLFFSTCFPPFSSLLQLSSGCDLCLCLLNLWGLIILPRYTKGSADPLPLLGLGDVLPKIGLFNLLQFIIENIISPNISGQERTTKGKKIVLRLPVATNRSIIENYFCDCTAITVIKFQH